MTFLLTILLSSALAADPKLDALLAKFQKTWDATKTYQADFKQNVLSKQMGTTDVSEGFLAVEKPSRLRWDTRTDGSLQILNGKKLTNVQENKRRKNRVVDIYHDVGKVMGGTPLKFLSGKAKFKELYQIQLVKETDEQAELKLTPKRAGEDPLVAEVDKKSYFLRALTTESVDSRVRIEFSNVKTNVKLDGKLFAFQPGPKDVVNEDK